MATTGKDFPLTITVRAVDKATSTLERLNKKLDAKFKPFRNFRDELGKLRDNTGITKIGDGLRGIGGLAKSAALGIGALGAAGAGAFLAIKSTVDEFDQLGGTAARLGVTVDALAQLRFAAQKSDVEVSELDAAFGSFNKQMGLARAKSGKLYGFLGKVSPVLRKQVLATKSSEEAFGLMADAIVKVEDPAKRAALATQVFGGSGQALIPLLRRGSKGIEELRARYFELAGSQEESAAAAGQMDDAMIDAGAAFTAIKGKILVGLAPAFTMLTEKVTAFFSGNRERIAEWARDFGEKLPARIERLGSVLKSIGEVIGDVGRTIGWLVDKVGGAENAVKLLAGGFIAFKGLQLAGHIGQIAQGFIGVGTAATGAMGAIGKLGGAIPILTGVYLAAKAAADQLDRAQTEDQDRRVNKGAVQHDLGAVEHAFGSRRKAKARRAFVRQLREQGLLDEKTGQLKAGSKTRDVFKTSDGWWNPFHDQDEAAQNKVEEVNRILREGPVVGAGITRPMQAPLGPARPALGPPAPPAKAELEVTFKNPPPGMQANIKSTTNTDVDLATGPQMGGW